MSAVQEKQEFPKGLKPKNTAPCNISSILLNELSQLAITENFNSFYLLRRIEFLNIA